MTNCSFLLTCECLAVSLYYTNMKALLLTNEYPPNIYGGAGIHVAYLSRELAKLCQVDVRCFGDQKLKNGSLSATGYPLNRLGKAHGECLAWLKSEYLK